jgi:hypothetical protein
MHLAKSHRLKIAATTIALLVVLGSAPGDEPEWIELTDSNDWSAWKEPVGDWKIVGAVKPDPDQPRRLSASPGEGVIMNGSTGRTTNLISRRTFGDAEVHLEFMVPKGSNSGIKLEGLYEIQIYDSWGVKKPKAGDCGGIYYRAELLPVYHRIDDGFPPRTNAARPAGEWQTLDIVFRAPRFDAEGKKTANAKFEKVVLNGELVQQDVEVKWPTGHAWHDKELAEGPILLQADHGPVAFRKVRVRPIAGSAKR